MESNGLNRCFFLSIIYFHASRMVLNTPLFYSLFVIVSMVFSFSLPIDLIAMAGME